MSNPSIDLQKFLFHTIQALQNHKTYSSEALIHLLRDLWLILSQGYFRLRKRRVLPPDVRDYTSEREAKYVEELVEQLCKSFAEMLLSITKQRRKTNKSSSKRLQGPPPPPSIPEISERSDSKRILQLSSMILTRICYQTTVTSHLTSALFWDILTKKNQALSSAIPEAIRAVGCLSKKLRLALVFSRLETESLESLHKNLEDIKASMFPLIELDKSSLAQMIWMLCVYGRLAIDGRAAEISDTMETRIMRSLQQNFAASVLSMDKRKPWSMMTLLNLSSQKESNSTWFQLPEGKEREQVDTVLFDNELVRSRLKSNPKTLAQFEGNLKILKLCLSVLPIWLRSLLQSSARTYESSSHKLSQKNEKDTKQVDADRLLDIKNSRRNHEGIPTGLADSKADVKKSKVQEKKDTSNRLRVKKRKSNNKIKTSSPQESMENLTKNQRNVFRQLSHHLVSQGSRNSSKASLTDGKSLYGDAMASAITIFGVRTIEQTSVSIQEESKQAKKEAVWNRISPFWRPEAKCSRAYRASSAISAMELLKQNCIIAGENALPLRIALQVESLAQIFTECSDLKSARGEEITETVRNHGCMVISIIDYFLTHPSPTYNVEPLIATFFGKYLSRGYTDPLLAYNAIQFCVKNQDTILSAHLTAFFPLLMKMLATFPTTFVDEFKILIRFLAAQDNIKCEMLHAILDLPLVSILVQVQKRVFSSTSVDVERLFSKSTDWKIYSYMLRNRACSLSSKPLARPSRNVIGATYFWASANARTTLAQKLVPMFINHFFDVALQTISLTESRRVLTGLIKRCDPTHRHHHLSDRLLAVCEKYPILMVHERKILISAVREGIKPIPGRKIGVEILLNIIWATGEYLQAEDTQAEFAVVSEYLNQLETVVDTQIMAHKRQNQAPSKRISPPMFIFSLLDIKAKKEENRNRISSTDAFDAQMSCRLLLVTLTALCKLASRCVEIVPAVRGVLIRILENRDVLPESVCLRASQCACLLQRPSIAYSLFKKPFHCSAHLSNVTSLEFMTNHQRESCFSSQRLDVEKAAETRRLRSGSFENKAMQLSLF